MEIYPFHGVFTKNDAPMDFKNPVRKELFLDTLEKFPCFVFNPLVPCCVFNPLVPGVH